jgi:hypothetical protein
MRFMMLVIPSDYGKAAPDAMPDPKQVNLMMKYNEGLQKAGVLLELNGLYPPSAGTRVVYSKDGKPKVIDGPFTEAKESIGGYWMIQVKSKEEAIEWASRIPFLGEETVEIRQVHEMTDCPPDVQEAAKKIPGMK